jgi:hypothetical protein
MKRFSISKDSCTIGFQEHVNIDLSKPVEDQLHRRKLFFRYGLDKGNARELIKIIECNSSLRIGFGWSFESTHIFEKVMHECEQAVKPTFTGDIVEMTSDTRCDWFGFVPFNTFDAAFYEDLCIEDLISFNNNLISYQTQVVKFVTSHPDYLYHAMVRDDGYRFKYFKERRKDPLALSSAFQYYVDAVRAASGVNTIPRCIIEEMIGCHFLYNPDVFFELLEFHALKGQVYE